MKKTIIISALLLILAIAYSLNLFKKTAQAYIYAYPLVLMDLTRDAMLGADTRYTDNRFVHVTRFPDHLFRNVVRPNNDTLYSTAWLDLTQGPLVLSVPDTMGRQYVMPFMDAWTNVYATIGKLNTGTSAANFIVVGPDYNGDPKQYSQITSEPIIQSPTNRNWIIGRIQTNGLDDVSDVNQLQFQFRLTPVEQWQEEQINQPLIANRSDKDASKDPNQYLRSLSATQYFSEVAQQLLTQSPLEDDEDALSNLASLGVKAGQPFTVNPLTEFIMNKAVAYTQKEVQRRLYEQRTLENGWAVLRQGLGRYGTNYGVRMAVAIAGLGALPPEEAIYASSEIDVTGEKLNGQYRYRVHFDADSLPPVNAFWSLTMYDEEGFFIANETNRYTLGDRDKLTFNPDGSLDILIQHQAPPEKSNWLPAPSGNFTVMLRMYMPKEQMLSGQWQVPGVERQ